MIGSNLALFKADGSITTTGGKREDSNKKVDRTFIQRQQSVALPQYYTTRLQFWLYMIGIFNLRPGSKRLSII